ncbi:BTAD domain-containing putative transcriptional regulator [Amorphoplanes digitatis]|uniref:DNA-binding SARP family transcriptional activator n=1 Tax=Actinoplanes digitatis TaxID=1868 RepID=A0A7W7MPL8_9ACTN|nr:BTAD domain-containing putative transcriptional regulator [Actinoplanes digitatis]MBB4761660.1 DNA-binding SARP family transcriptional activator [Actinoplanes digitatis]
MDSDGCALRFGILGTLEASVRGEAVDLGPVKQRTVLGLLLCRVNQVVPVAVLRDTLWPDEAPSSARKNLQGYVSTLRRILRVGPAGTGPLRHQPPGYLLRLRPEQLDALSFLELAQAGVAAARGGDTAAAAGMLGRAIGMWRGPVLCDLLDAPAVADDRERLHERYLTTFETWMEARLALGEHRELGGPIDDMVRRHPFRERLRHAQMLTLYRCGRQTEALAQYDALRQVLARELGLPPSPVLTRLYESILAGDPGLEPPPPSSAVTVAGSLPRDVDDFTGRAAAVESLVRELDASGPGQVVVVGGPVGAGKTALVVHCAHRLAGRFPDGRMFVGLRAQDGTARGVPEVLDAVRREVGGRPARLRDALAGRSVLLVLDDAVGEAQVRAVLAATGDAVVAVTSRRRLAGLESVRHRDLEPMPDEEAVLLLTRILGADRVAREPQGARSLAAACGGLPLAIRIAGARLAVLRHLSLSRYAARLADEGRLLDELVAGDLEIRSRLAVWYADLAPGDREWAHRLAALPGSAFSAAQLGGDPVRAEHAVERLFEAHVVRIQPAEVEAHAANGGVCYAVPPVVRAFLRDRPDG